MGAGHFDLTLTGMGLKNAKNLADLTCKRIGGNVSGNGLLLLVNPAVKIYFFTPAYID